MTESDLPTVECVGDVVHPAYLEDASICAERLQLYPAGCFVLEDGQDIQGYVVSHPWLFGQPPRLNTLLERLPAGANTLYIHDVALMRNLRGAGFGTEAVSHLVHQARGAGLPSVSLVAIDGSLSFWRNNGFEIVECDAVRARLLSYGESSTFMVQWLS